MRSIFAKTNIGDDEELREALTQKTDRGDDWAFRVISRSAKSIFNARCNWYAKENDGSEAFANERFQEGDDSVDAEAILVREGGNECFFVVLIGDEKREDKH
jgi:hypothetical protein